ncbi:hypothetical protein CR513_07357, partial [Mucuna pruriens]
MDRSMIDAASGGALMDKTPVVARHLISNMASNTSDQPWSRSYEGADKAIEIHHKSYEETDEN